MAKHGLLIDLDGVIYQGGRTIEGALDTLAWIEKQGIPHLFVTNTSARSRAALLEKFDGFGFHPLLDQLMTPIVAAVDYMKARQIRRIAALVSDDALQEFAGFELLPADSMGRVDAVVVGDLGEAWNYQCLNHAFRMLMRDPRPELVALGMTRYWRGEDGLLLDVAPFVSALENAAACKARVVGKPAEAFFQASIQRLQCSAEHCYMIGDDIESDVAAAQDCNIRGIQVRTGKFQQSDLGRGINPHAVLDSIADLPTWWHEQVTAT